MLHFSSKRMTIVMIGLDKPLRLLKGLFQLIMTKVDCH